MARVLILGGTTEARQLAKALADNGNFDVIVSLAGRTEEIVEHATPVRVGGFGGPNGLADYLKDKRIEMLVDATHPYAANISRNAVSAAAQAGVALLALRRNPWLPLPGDRWTELADIASAVQRLRELSPRAVFLTLGGQHLAPFVSAPGHRYLIRSIDPLVPPLDLPDAEYITARGPFVDADERALIEQHRIQLIVCRNSGGAAAYGKIAAARALGIDVWMLKRPELPPAETVETVADAVTWIAHAATSAAARGV